jgi:uncharacterized membrane protein
MREFSIPLGVSAIILFGVSIIASFLTSTSFGTWLSLAFALFVYGIVPGYSVLLFLPLKSFERVILAFGVSFGLVPLLLYVLDIFGFGFSRVTILFVILLIVVISVFFRKHWRLI